MKNINEIFDVDDKREKQIRDDIVSLFKLFNKDKVMVLKSILSSYKGKELQWSLIAYGIFLNAITNVSKPEVAEYAPKQGWS